MAKLGLILYLIGSFFQYGFSLFIDGCPMAGCRPSGSFSFYLQVPRENVSIKWLTDFVLDPLPSALGCVSDSVNIICPSNGPFSEDKGYMSLFNENGTIKWRDRKLHFPTLPLLDNYGDVTGSDGIKLVHYDADGKSYPSIPCEGLAPLFNMALVGNTFLLLVSQNGMVVVRETNGVPVGSLTLNATFGGINGTYLPIAQPVINEQRFYLLTEFAPLQGITRNTKRNRRLYAIDVHQSISNRITIAWHVDFQNKHKLTNKTQYKDTNYVIKSDAMREHVLGDTVTNRKASLIWNRYNNTLYVIIPPNNAENDSPNILSGIHDKGGDGEIIFQSRLDVLHMAMFVSDHCDTIDETKYSAINPKLWVVTQDSKIHQISEEGVSVHVIDLNYLFNISVSLTTKMSLVKNSDTDNDVLIFGIKYKIGYPNVIRENEQTTFVVAIDTSTNKVLWMVPIPENMTARGQITGVSGADMREKDQLIVYAETAGKNAKIFSIN
ncbi:uncharacterized protein LOC123547769 [Mercenaria mercenaria]|uniref:uncharacterized protein LOC123547769 n=1 Tax=Mercenaria mercenaria TaxID=6596 RepID=UPI001E1D8D0B|nr:uncharacterized protein LOC123547769 [Mercenaria mercenaria]